jgi:hypothetical protein
VTPKPFYCHSNFKHNIKKIYDRLNIIQDKHRNVDVKRTTDIVGEKIETKKTTDIVGEKIETKKIKKRE